MSLAEINPGADSPPPKMGIERGTIFDFLAGELLFSTVPGLSQSSGLVYDFKLPTVLQMYEMLDHDGKARSLEQVLVLPMIASEWRIEGTGEVAAWVDSVLRRTTLDGGMETPMANVLAQKAEAFVLRVSYHEKVFKSVDNRIVYSKIAWRPPDTCTQVRRREGGDLQGFAQWVLGTPIQVPILFPYADVYIHGAARDPVHGISDLTVTYHNYRIKEKLKFLWYTYCEVLSLPRQIVLGTSEEGGKKAAQAIAALRNAGVAGIPREWVGDVDNIKTIEVAGSGAADFQDAIGYLDSDSALSLLAGFTDLPARAMGTGTSHGPIGSYALAESAQNYFTDMTKAYAEELGAQVTSSLVADLVRYNFGIKATIPRFKIDLSQDAMAKAYDMLNRILGMQSTGLPTAFVQELVMIVAKQLGLNLQQVQKSLDEQQAQLEKEAKTPAQQRQAPLAAAADIGATLAAAANSPANSNGNGAS